MIILFLFSLLVDLIWFIFISRRVWNSSDYKHLAPWESGLHKTVNWVTVINFILKVSIKVEKKQVVTLQIDFVHRAFLLI